MTPNRIAARFEAAAASYEAATAIQRQVAHMLAEAVAAAGLRDEGHVAELGCGIGYLAEELLPVLRPSLWLATDISPAMLAVLNSRLAHPALTTAVVDATDPELSPGFDLVCSSLTLQWLPNQASAARRWRALVKPGGLLAVSTLVQGSFFEWRAALAAAGVAEPQPGFPTVAQLKAFFGPEVEVLIVILTERHPSGLDFARAARAAGIDAGLERPLDAGAMRRAFRAFEAGGSTVTYRVALVLDRA